MHMLPDNLFHVYHIIPAVELVAAVVKVRTDFKSHMLMETDTCLSEIFIFIFNVCDAGIEVGYILLLKNRFHNAV